MHNRPDRRGTGHRRYRPVGAARLRIDVGEGPAGAGVMIRGGVAVSFVDPALHGVRTAGSVRRAVWREAIAPSWSTRSSSGHHRSAPMEHRPHPRDTPGPCTHRRGYSPRPETPQHRLQLGRSPLTAPTRPGMAACGNRNHLDRHVPRSLGPAPSPTPLLRRRPHRQTPPTAAHQHPLHILRIGRNSQHDHLETPALVVRARRLPWPTSRSGTREHCWPGRTREFDRCSFIDTPFRARLQRPREATHRLAQRPSGG